MPSEPEIFVFSRRKKMATPQPTMPTTRNIGSILNMYIELGPNEEDKKRSEN